MRLPFAPPLAPMLSSAADALPGGEGWQFEPKWDGFRTLVFRDGDELLLQSRDEKTMNRYFPELIAPLAATLPERCVVDGEIVIVGVGGLDFETLLLRIHPAASRVKLLSAQAPASFVAWDLLALCATRLSPSGANGSSTCWPTRRRRCTSHRLRAIERLRRTGSTASRAPGSM